MDVAQAYFMHPKTSHIFSVGRIVYLGVTFPSAAMFTAAFNSSEVTLEGDVSLDDDIIFFSLL